MISRWEPILSLGRPPEGEQLVSHSKERARKAKVRAFPKEIVPELATLLAKAGIDKLYSHQVEAFECAAKENVIITTAAASGKSLCFNLPVLNRIAKDPKARSLYIYPTKALAQDQARKLAALGLPQLRQAIYDGDTTSSERKEIRKRSNLVLTNPDMLNVGILPHHELWGDFLANLEFIILDEAHTYRGVFGSHVANVIRRLRRICRLYRAEPRLILTSATIANPVELARDLCAAPFKLVEKDGAPRIGRTVAIWNPPQIDGKSGTRKSALSESASLFARLVGGGSRTICFSRTRRGAELIYKFARDQLERSAPEAAARIAPYRAGYTPQQRRQIERRLAEGDLLGVTATNALELGIDIGELEAAICVTYPGTVASLRQQWGRAGRTSHGLAVYVAGDDALDQFFCRHPGEFLKRPVEAALLDHCNESIFKSHLVAAAYEGPITAKDEEIFGPGLIDVAKKLADEGRLRQSKGRFLPAGPGFPARQISLRSASNDSFDIIDDGTGELIGTVEAERAFTTVHPGAIYLHMGERYQVHELDIDGRRALVRGFEGDYYTQPKSENETFIEQVELSRETAGVKLSYGKVTVTEALLAYQKKRLSDSEVLDLVSLELPDQNFPTRALWYTFQREGLDQMPLDILLGSLHAVEHAQIAVLPLIAICDRWDIGGLSTNFHFQTGQATIFIYDGHPGGVGITKRGYDMFEDLTGNALRLVSECPCDSGCPSCVQSPKCGNLNEPLHKQGAIELMQGMLAAGEPRGQTQMGSDPD